MESVFDLQGTQAAVSEYFLLDPRIEPQEETLERPEIFAMVSF
jgi:hypothetical protein